MAFDERLATRVRDALPPHATEKRMFGGLSFLLGGHLAVAVGSGDVMIRVGVDGTEAALALPGARPCTMGERTMRGWVLVDAADLATDEALTAWSDRAAAFVQTLPRK